MEKFLVVGALGNLGSELAISLFKQKKEVVIMTHHDSDNYSCEFMESGLADFLNICQPDVVINAAAYNAVDKCENDPEEYMKAILLNRTLPRRLAQWCHANGKALVHYSTDYVFDGNNPAGYQEKDFCGHCRYVAEEDHCLYRERIATHPEANWYTQTSRYGYTKSLGEAAVFCDLTGLSYYIIRVAKLFGNQGAEFSGVSFFEQALEKLQRGETIKTITDETGSFAYIPDVAKATWDIINNYPSGIYHVVNEGQYSWYEAISLMNSIASNTMNKQGFAEELIIKVKAEELQRAAKRPKFSHLLNTVGPVMPTLENALLRWLSTKKL